jgi:hypothetical protein
MSRNRVSYQSESLFICRDALKSHFRDGANHESEDMNNIFPILYDGENVTTRRNLPFNHPNGNLVEQLQRVQSINYDINIPTVNIHQFGMLGRIDSLLVETPVVNLNFTYLLADAYNEKLLNFNVGTHPQDFDTNPFLYRDHNTFRHYISNPNGSNLFIETGKDGHDLYSELIQETDKNTVAIGSAFLNNYGVEAAVGSLPTASVDFTALNAEAHSGTKDLPVPTINPVGIRPDFKFSLPDYKINHEVEIDLLNGVLDEGISTIRPGDIVVVLHDEEHGLFVKHNEEIDGWTKGACNLQSFQIDCRFERTPITRLGKIWANTYTLDKAPTVVLRLTGLVSELKQSGLGNALCEGGASVSIYLFDPCANRNIQDRSTVSMIYTFRDLKLESEQFSSAIGDNKAVDIVLSTSCEAQDKNRSGFYIWGRAFEGVLIHDGQGNPINVDPTNPLGLFGAYNRGI